MQPSSSFGSQLTLERSGSSAAKLASPKPASSRQSDAYLSELLSYSIDRLRKEPELLKEEKQTIERSIQGTAVNNYGAFIETSRCLETINTELGTVCERLDLLLQVHHEPMHVFRNPHPMHVPSMAHACASRAALHAI